MKLIDVYDFDKTIYLGDSSIDFYIFCLIHKFSIVKILPKQLYTFLLYKLGIKTKLEFKEEFFSFLKYIDNIEDYIDEFWLKNKKKINYKIIQKSKNDIVIISASPYFLLKKICEEIGCYKLIASDVNEYTGKFNGANCYGKEKVNRLNVEIKEYSICNFFSDSKSDIFLAKLAKKSYLIKGRKIKRWKL